MQSLPTFYLSHGGGPWPWMLERGDERFAGLQSFLRGLREELRDAPTAVLVISGHWETNGIRISSASQPSMLFDYRGFPDWAYALRYDAPGSPDLALAIKERLDRGGIDVALDPDRGFDHGTFSLMRPIYPEAQMPVVQMSIDARFDPELHLRIGALLAPLRRQGVLIVGSGSSFHNMQALLSGGGQAESRLFDDWLKHTMLAAPPERRWEGLIRWADAPAARQAHPREDHLVPLFVAAGAAIDEPIERVFYDPAFLGAAAMSSFRFGQFTV